MTNGFFKPKSFHFQWHITERCNLRCKHCYFEPKFLKNELSTKQLFGVFEQYLELIKQWGLSRESNRISITGGEPLQRKDLFELIQKFYEHKDKTRYSLMTNGTTLNEEHVEKLKELEVSNVQVSLEGLEETNDSIRGKESFEKAVNGIKILLENGIDTSVSMTVTNANLQEVPAMIEFCKAKRISFLGIRRLVPIGRGEKMRGLMLSPKQTKQLYYYCYKKNFELKEEKSSLEIGLGCEDGLLAQNHHYNPKSCSAAYNSLTMLPNGDVYPCRRLPIKAGNALEKNLGEIYYNSKELNELRNQNNAHELCQQCPYWIECRGGAKCASYGYFGNAFAPDPQCWRLFSELSLEAFKTVKKTESGLNEELIWRDENAEK